MGQSGVSSYRDLLVWKQAMDLAEACYRMTANFPKSETYGLTGQLRRSAASVPANIAEGYGRETTGSYIQFLRVAQGSLKELETHLLLATRVDLVTGGVAEPLLGQCESVGKLLHLLIRSLQDKRMDSPTPLLPYSPLERGTS